MERLKRAVGQDRTTTADYEPVRTDGLDEIESSVYEHHDKAPFSWTEYLIFMLLGVSMLWAWCVLLIRTGLDVG